MTNKSVLGGTTGKELGASSIAHRITYGILRNHHFATGAPALIVNTTQGINVTIEETIFKHVDEVPLDTLCDYWITKHGWDWVKDVDVHKTKFDSLS